jgi:hypothetical protein
MLKRTVQLFEGVLWGVPLVNSVGRPDRLKSHPVGPRILCSVWAKDRPNAAKDDSAMVERIAEIRRYGGSTIGVTGEDASDKAFH